MRFALRYHAEYRYDGPVFDQHNVLRVKPAATPLQRVRGFRLTVEPNAAHADYVDYFGTEVIEFNVPGEHERLAITAEAEVTTQAPPRARREQLGRPARRGLHRRRRRVPAAHRRRAASNGALDELHEAVRADAPHEALQRVCQVIPERFEYRPGATFVGSTVDDLLEGGPASARTSSTSR